MGCGQQQYADAQLFRCECCDTNSKARAFASRLRVATIITPKSVERMHGIKHEMGGEAQRHGRVPNVLP